MGRNKVVAKALSKDADRKQSSRSTVLCGRKLTAYTCGLLIASASITSGLSLSMVLPQAAAAADFSHAQHVFVPPTSIPRHFDSESLNYGNATGDSPDLYPSSSINSGSVNGASIKTTTQNGRSFNKTVIDSRTTQPRHTSIVGGGANSDASPAMNAFVTQARAKSQLLVKQGKLSAAENMLQTDLQAVPKSQGLQTELANVRVARARYALKTGDTASATQHAEAALLVQPGNSAAKQVLAETSQKATATTNSIAEHLSKAKTLMAQANYTEANKEIQSAIRIKETADTHTSLGDLAFKQGNKELARTEYARALQLDPESGPALRQNGIFKLHENDIVGANKDLSRAIIINSKDKEAAMALQKIWQGQVAKNPLSPNAHLGLARAYQLAEELPAAQAEYKEVVRLDPQHPSIPAARQSFKLALAKQESVKCLQAAKTLEDAGALSEAHQKALEAVNISPSCVSARIYQGAICEKLNMFAEAHDAYMTALKYDPKNTIAARHLRALQGMANSAETASSSAGTSAAAAAEPKAPPGMYIFRGWEYGHPLANNTGANGQPGAGTASFGGAQQGTYDASSQTNNYTGAQTANYGNGAPPAMINGVATGMGMGAGIGGGMASPLTALSAGPALALPGGPTTAQLADPIAPMPLQGTPPVAASTTAHVNAFSSFLGSIRDLTIAQKQQSQQIESAMSSVLNPSGSSSGLGGLGIGTSGAGSATGLGLSGLPAGIGSGAALPPVSTPSSSGVSSVLAQAAAAIANAGGSSSAPSSSAPSSASAADPNSANGTVTNINVNGTNIQITSPPGSGSATTSATGASSTAAGSGQSVSGAAWDAAPAWLKKKFPNMTQQDFTAMAGKFKGSLKSKLQALAAQQKAAENGQGTAPTAAQAAQSLAGLLPPGVDLSALGIKNTGVASGTGTGSTSVRTDVAANVLTAAGGTGSGADQAEQELLAKAGQDAPTMAPPDVVPEGVPVVQTTVVLKAKTPDGNATQAATSLAAAAVPGRPSVTDNSFGAPLLSSASSASPSSTNDANGLHAQAQSLATAGGINPLSSTAAASNAALSATAVPTDLAPLLRGPAASPTNPAPASPASNAAMSRTDLHSVDASKDDSNSNDNSNASVVLELQGYSPTATGIRLKVILKNSRTRSLSLPDSARAVIHMPGAADKEAKITFSSREVSAGGIVQGVIKVPGHDLNPSADLVLPNFLPVTFADRDVHLTVPISALMK